VGIQELIENFNLFRTARIRTLQTTFFELECFQAGVGAPRAFRIHYRNKYEFQLKAGEIKSIALETNQPLLLQYHEPIGTLQLVSKVTDKACFLNQLEFATNEIFHGWRRAVDYCFMPPENFIEKSFGRLMEAPESYVIAVTDRAKECDVKLLFSLGGKPVAPSANALIMDKMYVIADDFFQDELV
jgi:hypothetical protein